MPLPALLTIQSGINQLRYATLKGIMAAKKKEIRKVDARLPAAARAADSSASTCPRRRKTDADDCRVRRRKRPRSSSRSLRDEARVI